MLEFAVTVEGITKEGQAQWVLAVDPVGERLLIVHEDSSLAWHPMSACRFAKLVPPDAPRPVVPVQMAQAAQHPVLALPNRGERRRMQLNGN